MEQRYSMKVNTIKFIHAFHEFWTTMSSLGRHAYFERDISHSGHFWESVTKRIAVKPLLRALLNDLELLQRGFKYQLFMYTI